MHGEEFIWVTFLMHTNQMKLSERSSMWREKEQQTTMTTPTPTTKAFSIKQRWPKAEFNGIRVSYLSLSLFLSLSLISLSLLFSSQLIFITLSFRDSLSRTPSLTSTLTFSLRSGNQIMSELNQSLWWKPKPDDRQWPRFWMSSALDHRAKSV